MRTALGPTQRIPIRGVSLFQGLFNRGKILSGPHAVSTLQWMSVFQGCPKDGVPLYFLVRDGELRFKWQMAHTVIARITVDIVELQTVTQENIYLRTNPLHKIIHFRLSVMSVIISWRRKQCQFSHACREMHKEKVTQTALILTVNTFFSQWRVYEWRLCWSSA